MLSWGVGGSAYGSPIDEDEYLISAQDAAQTFPHVEVAVSFFGHKHVQGGFGAMNRQVRRFQAWRGNRSG